MTDQKIAERIAALLRKAESTTNPHEAEAFSAKAEELMLKHAIEESMLPTDGKPAEAVVSKTVVFTGGYHADELLMAWQVVRALSLTGYKGHVGKYMNADGKMRNGQPLYVIGHESDAASARVLIASLLLQCHSARRAWWKDFDGKQLMTAAEREVANRAFIRSFGEGAAVRIKVAKKTAETEYESTHGEGCLVVVKDRKQREIDEFFAQQGTRKTNARGRASNAAGRSAGRDAGSRADTGSTRINGGSRAIGA
jgi:hypothetical protein